jgi:hypothetical protein
MSEVVETYKSEWKRSYEIACKVRRLHESGAEEGESENDVYFRFRLLMADAVDTHRMYGYLLLRHLVGSSLDAKRFREGARAAVFGSAELPSWWDERGMSRMIRDAGDDVFSGSGNFR